MTKIDIISGFLGAGKTTFIKKMIDAFIIRSYQDEDHEVAQGLALGLKDARGKKKTAYNVFCNMDGVNSLKYTKKVLNNQVGNWKAQVPGYTAKKVSGMYRK